MLPHTINPYKLADQDEIERLFFKLWEGSAFPFDPAGRHADLRSIPSTYQVNGGQFWVLREEPKLKGSQLKESKLIGAIAIKFLADGVGEIKRLCVHPDYRGRGFGDLLFKHAIDSASKLNFHTLRLDSVRNFAPALHLYDKYGFIEIPRYNENPKADVFMELELKNYIGRNSA